MLPLNRLLVFVAKKIALNSLTVFLHLQSCYLCLTTMCLLQEPPECPDSNGAGMPGKCHTLHASMQNVSLPVTLNGGGTGDAPSTPPRVIRPVTLQVPDVDSGGNSANVITDQGDTTTDDDEGVFVCRFLMGQMCDVVCCVCWSNTIQYVNFYCV